MIRRIQALNYRCLRYVDVELDRFQVAVGANATGKSTLFDALAFLGDLVRDGLDAAVEKRTRNFQDLVFGRPGKDLRFELAVELDAPDGMLPAEWYEALTDRGPWRLRHEIAVHEGERGVRIAHERALLVSTAGAACGPRVAGSSETTAVSTLAVAHETANRSQVLAGAKAEATSAGGGWTPILLAESTGGVKHSVLNFFPDQPEGFAELERVQRVFVDGIRPLCLEPHGLRTPSPPALRRSGIAPDGSTLAWEVQELRQEHPAAYGEWMEHVRTTLEELVDVSVNEREDERTAYLVLEYTSGIRVPSWVASDGTLRFLLLTLIAHLPRAGLYLIEEPENGLHPFALDAVYDSLSYPGKSQVVAGSHSLEFVQLAEPEQILCFATDAEGGTRIVRGTDHPIFKGAEKKPDVRLLFATGTLG